MKIKPLLRPAAWVLILMIAVLPVAYKWYAARQAARAEKAIRSSPYWQQKVKEFGMISSKPAIVMIGNSLTNRFDHSVFGREDIVNMGISGDMTSALLDRLDQATRLKPSKIFVEIGINDVVERVSGQEIVANWKMMLERIRRESPESRIYFMSLMPVDMPASLLRWGNTVNNTVVALNGQLKQLCSNYGATYVDLHSAMLENGRLKKEYSEDGVHFTAAGYETWKRVLEPLMEE